MNEAGVGTFAAELEAARDAAVRAGDEVLRMRQEGLRYGRKFGHELISEADLRAAEILYDQLTRAFPDAGWLSEEHVDTVHRLGKERVWVVDPIDGTREYLLGLPEYAVSVALVVAGEPVLGVVYNPAAGDLHTAVCTNAEERAAEYVEGTYSVLVGHGEAGWDRVPSLPRGAEPRPVGSVAYRLALVATGKGDATLSGYARAEWDVAAGFALCRAAGLRVTDVLGVPVRFNQPDPTVRGLLVAAPGLHQRIQAHFRLLM
ncbi:MAG: hypothetical protein Kow0010_12500 [Dehalococcoidia bacterium]